MAAQDFKLSYFNFEVGRTRIGIVKKKKGGECVYIYMYILPPCLPSPDCAVLWTNHMKICANIVWYICKRELIKSKAC